VSERKFFQIEKEKESKGKGTERGKRGVKEGRNMSVRETERARSHKSFGGTGKDSEGPNGGNGLRLTGTP